MTDGFFYTPIERPARSTHIVLNYIGPNNGQGTRIYIDGIQTASSNVISSYTFQPGAGRVVIGRLSIDDYASVDVDELLFFNETRSDQNIQDMSN